MSFPKSFTTITITDVTALWVYSLEWFPLTDDTRCKHPTRKNKTSLVSSHMCLRPGKNIHYWCHCTLGFLFRAVSSDRWHRVCTSKRKIRPVSSLVIHVWGLERTSIISRMEHVEFLSSSTCGSWELHTCRGFYAGHPQSQTCSHMSAEATKRTHNFSITSKMTVNYGSPLTYHFRLYDDNDQSNVQQYETSHLNS